MPDDKPSKADVKNAMAVFFGPQGGEGIGLDEPEKPVVPPVDAPVEPLVEPKPVEKKETETPPAEPVVTEPPAAPAKEARRKVVKKAVATEPPNIDQATIERVASATAARTVAEMVKEPAAPAHVQPEGLDLDDGDKAVIAEMQLAARHNAKFADLPDRTLKFWKSEQDYIAGWQKQNPGQTYKKEDHEDFYTKHEPQFDETEFAQTIKKAEREELKTELRQEAASEAKGEVSKLRFENRWKEEAPEITTAANKTAAGMIAAIDPELAKVLQVGEEMVLNPETLAKLEEVDPVAGRIVKRQAGYLARMIQEVERLDRYPDHYRGDAANPLHVALFNAALELEEKIAALPAEDQLEDGKKFIRQSEFNRALDEIEKGPGDPAQKEAKKKALAGQCWTLDADDVKEAITTKVRVHTAKKIKEDREIVELALKKRGGPALVTPPTAAPAATTPPSAQPPVAAPAERPKPPSTMGGGGDKTSTQNPPAALNGNIQEQVDKVFFR